MRVQDLETCLRERLSQAINERVFPGAVTGMVWLDKKHQVALRLVVPCGKITYQRESPSVKGETIYDLASVTKVIPTASALLALIDLGEITLDAPAFLYLPEVFNTGEDKQSVTVQHLLTYTVSFELPSLTSMRDERPEAIIQKILSAPLKNAPGSSVRYTNATAILMGMIVEATLHKELGQFADDYFFRPLGMLRTRFHPGQMPLHEIAPTESDTWRRRLIWGEVHDEGTWALGRSGRTFGSAGLFSTTPDLLTFLEVLLRSGITKDGFRYFKPETVTAMHTNHLAHIGAHGGLGWELNQPWMGEERHTSTFGKTGFTGCSVLVDPGHGVGIVLLSNHIHPKRPATRDAITTLRRDVADIMFRAIDRL